MYIHIGLLQRLPDRHRARAHAVVRLLGGGLRKGTNGYSNFIGFCIRVTNFNRVTNGYSNFNGVTSWVLQLHGYSNNKLQLSCFLREGPFGYPAEPTFIFPNVPGRTFSPNLSKLLAFAAAPLVLTPFVRNQVPLIMIMITIMMIVITIQIIIIIILILLLILIMIIILYN